MNDSERFSLTMEGDAKRYISAVPSSSPAAAASREKCSSLGKGHILIVDDEQGICRLLSDGLRMQGFDCCAASGGAEALKLLETQPFDAVISDLQMPGTTGLDLLKVVYDKHPGVAFLMATAVDDVRVGIEAMKTGSDDYLLKPFRLGEVVIALSRALERKRLARELEDQRRRLERLVDLRTRQVLVAHQLTGEVREKTLEGLCAVLEVRHNETAGHSRRVNRCCLEIAKALGCSSKQLETIGRGAYLHDIGKIGIPDAILLKPDQLTEEEWAVIGDPHANRVRIGFLPPVLGGFGGNRSKPS